MRSDGVRGDTHGLCVVGTTGFGRKVQEPRALRDAVGRGLPDVGGILSCQR
jgi:hypothetical protein